jgi:hypothetical protein
MAVIKASDLARTIKKKLDASGKKAYKQWAKEGSRLAKDLINELLDAGKSPVAGEGSFKKYADSTKNRKRKLGQQTSPVNLKDTGKLRDSLTTRAQAKSIAVWFSGSRNAELFDIHTNLGASVKKVIRRMLPTKGKKWHKSIRDAMRDLFIRIYKV